MKRILHVVGGMDRAGAETMLMNLYRKLDKQSYQFDFVYFRSTPCDYDEEIEALGGRIFRIPIGNPISRMFSLKKLIEKEAPFHAVHCHMLFGNGLHLFSAKLAKSSMRIAHSHNTSDNNSSSFAGRMYQNFSRVLMKKYATHYIACGKEAGTFLFPKVKNKIEYLFNAVDIESFASVRKEHRDYLRKELNLDSRTKIITQIGRLHIVKNYEFSINLCSYLLGEGLDLHFVFVGSGSLGSRLEELVHKNNLSDKISFLGTRSDIPKILAGSDLLIMPSLYEGFPVVLVESQACGVPALIADTITQEVELGMGLIEFLNLSDDSSIWKEKLVDMTHRVDVSKEERLDTLTEKGFNIYESVKKLEKLYG